MGVEQGLPATHPTGDDRVPPAGIERRQFEEHRRRRTARALVGDVQAGVGVGQLVAVEHVHLRHLHVRVAGAQRVRAATPR